MPHPLLLRSKLLGVLTLEVVVTVDPVGMDAPVVVSKEHGH